MEAARAKPAWLVLAIASGACAAFNGVFAKLYVHQIRFLKIPSANANTIYCLGLLRSSLHHGQAQYQGA